jgi:hypothetical protein
LLDKTIGAILTDANNNWIAPDMAHSDTSWHTSPSDSWYYLSGHSANSPELIFALTSSRSIAEGEELRMHYGEALDANSAEDNSGTSYADIYVQTSCGGA